VSNLGRVRSLDRITDRGRKWRGRIMSPAPMGPSGYLVVTLWRDGKQRTALVHRLVLTAFVGPSDFEVRHKYGDPADNRLAHLAWGTHSENQFDQVAHGTHANASKDECPAGHAYDEANTYVYPGRAHRGCRACRRSYARNYQRKGVAA
ncbi:MAG TPA: NUMOD4 motif-containing HNH endonuclease, partial [Pedococcus sp.]|nr:NUMOD4 motif-containing HNH endonuclease [Pedococcus sp.]